VNDFEIVLRGLESMLASFDERVAVVEMDVARNPDSRVDVALFDTYGHPRLGLDRIASLAHDRHVGAVAVYTWSFPPERLDAALAAGARGVLPKSMPASELVDAIEQIAHDEEIVSSHFARSASQPWPGHDLGLTLRESEVASFLAQGMRNRDIAAALWVSENTVKTHLKSIFQKTAVTSRGEAIVRISRDEGFSSRRHEYRGRAEREQRVAGGAHPSR
jgi:DNA-binding NarL/FixJ family response regulator